MAQGYLEHTELLLVQLDQLDGLMLLGSERWTFAPHLLLLPAEQQSHDAHANSH